MISQKYKNLYLSTSKQQLKQLSRLLLSLEKKPQGGILIENIFRLIHSMKGAAATMSYKKTVELLHAVENIIDAAYHEDLILDQKAIDLFFSIAEALKNNYESISKNDREINLKKDLDNLNIFCKKKIKSKKSSKSVTIKQTKNIINDLHIDAEISVSTDKLNSLQNLTDDLLVNMMKVKYLLQNTNDSKMLSLCVNTDTIVNNLRRELEKLRIVPLSDIFSSLPYLVRDMAKIENKQVDLVVNDNNLSLDKSILDELIEIIIQLIKNSIAHGITTTQKNGRIDIEASLINDRMQVTVKDNGQGINWPDLVDRAIKKKIITKPASKKLTVQEIKDLIFITGIASSQNPTISSGRGVGLSLVKEKVRALDGDISLESSKNGTIFTITIPLPLSIFRSLNFRLGDFTLTIPLSYIHEIVKLDQAKEFNSQSYTRQKVKFKLVNLAKIFPVPKFQYLAKYIILIKFQDNNLALPIFSNIKETEIVMKRTPQVLKNLKYIKGVAVSGEGQPILILDINNL